MEVVGRIYEKSVASSKTKTLALQNKTAFQPRRIFQRLRLLASAAYAECQKISKELLWMEDERMIVKSKKTIRKTLTVIGRYHLSVRIVYRLTCLCRGRELG